MISGNVLKAAFAYGGMAVLSPRIPILHMVDEL